MKLERGVKVDILKLFPERDKLLESLKERLLIELQLQDKSGIYAVTSKRLAYNSNKIEGTSLTPEHTETLFDEGYLSKGDFYKAQEIEEMQGHFLMFNYMLSVLDKPLSEDVIKKLHYELKAGVFHDRANGYAIGEYKTRANLVGSVVTVAPREVPEAVRELLSWYHTQDKTLEVLADFHIKYERVHPFQDGNGRTGRVLLFKEALCNNITPFIISDEDRITYIECLKTQDVIGMVELFKKCQQSYQDLLDLFFS